MVVQRHGQVDRCNECLEIEINKFRRVQQFKYLGVLITQQNEISMEIKARIQAGNKCYFGMKVIKI